MQRTTTSSRFLACAFVTTTISTAVLSGVFFCATPHETLASASSQGGELDLPKGATPWDEVVPAFTGVLRALASEKEAGTNAAGTQAIVVAWKGANYKAGRASFTRTAIYGALGKEGYTVRTIDSNRLRNVNPSEHFDEGATFQPDIWKLPVYFVAINEAKGQGLVGALLESDKALVLGFLPIGVKAQEKTSLPQVGGALLVKDGNDAMKGVAAPKTPDFAPITRKPKTASGQIKDAGGKPIAGATVHVESGAFGGIRTDHRARTDAQGRYAVILPTGVCRVTSAYATIAYNGRNYALPLHPTDGQLEQFDSGKGHVENFVLKTYGATGPASANDPDKGTLYYGGSLRLMWMSEISEGGTFEVTLTPQGVLLGSGKGRTLIFRFPNKNNERVLNDIPLGCYQISARLLDGEDTAPVRLEKYGSNKLVASLTLDFEPVSGTTPDFGYSGVRQVSVLLRP